MSRLHLPLAVGLLTGGGLAEVSYFVTENIGLFLRTDALIGFQSRDDLNEDYGYAQSIYTISLGAGLTVRL